MPNVRGVKYAVRRLCPVGTVPEGRIFSLFSETQSGMSYDELELIIS